MTERKWTPGPWRTEKNPRFECLEVFSGRSRVGSINAANDVTFGPPTNEAISNAHLIAAAPDMYEALDNLIAVKRGEGGTKYHAEEIADAALAKARGEQ